MAGLYFTLLRPIALLLCIVVSASAWADLSAQQDRLRFSGFTTVGLTRSGSDILGFRRNLDQEGLFDQDWSLKAESLLGLQLDFQLLDSLDGAVQVLARDRIENDLSTNVQWAYLRYRPNRDWTIRLGRVGFDVFSLSDYRNLGFAYLWARPPVEFYTPVAFEHFDGADVAWTTPAGDGYLRVKIIAGESENTFEVLGQEITLTLGKIFGGSISWESDNWQARITASRNSLDDEAGYFPRAEIFALALQQVSVIWPAANEYADALVMDKSYFYYHSLGVVYDSQPWRLQAEISTIDSKIDLFPSTYNGYFSVGYQAGSVTPYGLFSWGKTKDGRREVEDAPLFADLQLGIQSLFDAPRIKQHTLSAGVRWDVRYDLALKAQFDRSWVSAHSGALWDQREIPQEDETINTITINLNFIF
jgi:hypothetical protein